MNLPFVFFMVGIYKITSPTGKIYIGQSWNIHKRWLDHKKPQKINTPISKSVLKHGANTHTFIIIHELPFDISQEVLTMYEQFYIDAYRGTGHYMLNLRDAGNRGRHNETTKKKMSVSQTGRKHSEEAKRKMSLARTGKPGNRKGYKMTDEQIQKISESKKGFKHTEEAKLKISLNSSKHNKGKPMSNEAKQKMIALKVGKKQTDYHKNKISKALKGKPKSENHNKKVSEALIVYFSNPDNKRVPWNKGIPSGRKGIPHSEEHKRNISIAHKKRFANSTPSTSYMQVS